MSLEFVRRKGAAWRSGYDEKEPYRILCDQTPTAFASEIGGRNGCGEYRSSLGWETLRGSHIQDDGDSSLSGEFAKQENWIEEEHGVV
jgi:hypothetical protein